ncbi:MAG: hypothetical protein ACRDXB_13255 [Actinomycetes bacterium]
MSRNDLPDAAGHYDVRVDGHLDEHWSVWFGARTVTHVADGTTSLRCVVADQAELHGLFTKVRDLGLILVSVTRVKPDGPVSREQQCPLLKPSPDSRHSNKHQQHPANPKPSARPPEQE